MPSAPPSSRETSLTADATPCFSRGQRRDDRRRGGRACERHARTERDQTGEEVPVRRVDAERRDDGEAGRHQREAGGAGDADADARPAIAGATPRERDHDERHRERVPRTAWSGEKPQHELQVRQREEEEAERREELHRDRQRARRRSRGAGSCAGRASARAAAAPRSRTRRSRRRRSASAPRRSTGSLQPRSGPSMIPKTSAARARRPRAACRRGRGAGGRGLAGRRHDRDRAHQREGCEHDVERRRSTARRTTRAAAPEASSPITAPPAATPTHVPTALPRSSGGKIVVITDSVTGITNAAPTPMQRAQPDQLAGACRGRAPRARRARRATSPAMRIGLRPKRSPIAPAGRSSAANDERVGVDDPLQLRLGRPRVTRQLGERDVEAGHGGHDHHQGEAHHAEHRAPLFSLVLEPDSAVSSHASFVKSSFVEFNECRLLSWRCQAPDEAGGRPGDDTDPCSDRGRGAHAVRGGRLRPRNAALDRHGGRGRSRARRPLLRVEGGALPRGHSASPRARRRHGLGCRGPARGRGTPARRGGRGDARGPETRAVVLARLRSAASHPEAAALVRDPSRATWRFSPARSPTTGPRPAPCSSGRRSSGSRSPATSSRSSRSRRCRHPTSSRPRPDVPALPRRAAVSSDRRSAAPRGPPSRASRRPSGQRRRPRLRRWWGRTAPRRSGLDAVRRSRSSTGSFISAKASSMPRRVELALSATASRRRSRRCR